MQAFVAVSKCRRAENMVGQVTMTEVNKLNRKPSNSQFFWLVFLLITEPRFLVGGLKGNTRFIVTLIKIMMQTRHHSLVTIGASSRLAQVNKSQRGQNAEVCLTRVKRSL